MRKRYLFAATLAVPFLANAQSAIDGFRFSQPDLKGTARYMAMGGAFGALGGDLSSISTNPAGLGVYRRNEIGITMDVDIQSATSECQGSKDTQNQTKFLFNNVGGVASWNLASPVMPNINIGFTYNRGASFNQHYSGTIPNLKNSLTNYIAGVSNSNGVSVGDVKLEDDSDGNLIYDPYNPPIIPNVKTFYTPWISILGYDSYFITPSGDDDQPDWIGQWGTTTTGSGAFDVVTTGGINEYNLAIGGNISNKVFWGVDFGIANLNYNMTAVWGEKLQNAVVNNPDGNENSSANWTLTNRYIANGTGFNIKVGFIYRPIQELRLGIAFASPTWYSINENYIASTNFDYSVKIPDMQMPYAITNGGNWGSNSYNFQTPWCLTASAAGVIGKNFILSADFEWKRYDKMRFSEKYVDNGYDGWYDDYYTPYSSISNIFDEEIPWDEATNKEVETYYKSTSTIRLGAEYRITPRFSVRAGYAHVSSPVSKAMRNDNLDTSVWTDGTMPNYTNNNSTNYYTCGLGYNFNNFYIDGAFVHKRLSSVYHAYTFDPANPQIPSPTSKLSLSNNQIILSAGFRF